MNNVKEKEYSHLFNYEIKVESIKDKVIWCVGFDDYYIARKYLVKCKYSKKVRVIGYINNIGGSCPWLGI